MREQLGEFNLAPSKVLASAATGVVDLIERNHGDVDTIFGQVGIHLTDLSSPINAISLNQYCALFDVAARTTGNDNIGLEFGHNFAPKCLGAIGYTALSSPTLSAALRDMKKYFPAHQEQTSFDLIQDDDVLWLSYHIHDPRIKNRRQDAELSLGMFHNIFKAALGANWSPLEIRFEHDRPDDVQEHETYFGAPVRFGRRTNAFAFHRHDLAARMPGQDPYLFAMVAAFLESRCKRVDNIENLATVVRDQIKLQLGDKLPTLPKIANALGLTNVAFHKRLKAQHLLFPDLLRAARRELALHYLNDPDMSLTEIAYNLGYSELSAFSRAFRNWTGMNPQKYRHTKKQA